MTSKISREDAIKLHSLDSKVKYEYSAERGFKFENYKKAEREYSSFRQELGLHVLEAERVVWFVFTNYENLPEQILLEDVL